MGSPDCGCAAAPPPAVGVWRDLPLAEPNPTSPRREGRVRQERVLDLGDPDCPFVEPLPKALADEVRRWRAESDRQVAEFDRMIAEARHRAEFPEEVERERRERPWSGARAAPRDSGSFGASRAGASGLTPDALAQIRAILPLAERPTTAQRTDPSSLQESAREAGLIPRFFAPDSQDEAPKSPGAGSAYSAYSGDSCGQTNSSLGLNNVALDLDDSGIQRTRGEPQDVMTDLVDLGAGFGRQLGPSDLLFRSLFPDEVIPAPDVLLQRLQTETERFTNFSNALMLAVRKGVAITPTLFAWGGGAGINDLQSDPNAPLGDTGLTYGQIKAGMPSQQGAMIFPNALGWDPWYWDFDDTPPVELKRYQRFALNLHFYDDPQQRSDESYMRRSAARKRLGVAAFAMGIGAYLARWERLLGQRMWEAINILELGNEMDSFWSTEAAAEEFGRFLALLAGPIRVATPNARCRAGELASWVVNRYNLASAGGATPDSERNQRWEEKLDWLRHALAIGMGKEVQRWENVEDDWAEALHGGFGLPQIHDPEDLEAATETGVFWPPIPEWDRRGRITERYSPSNKRQLLQQVGFHFYHTTDEPAGDPSPQTTYEGERRLMHDADRFEQRVVRPLNAAGWNLTWSVSETSFPSTSNDDINYPPQSTHATEMMQAGLLARRLLSFRAKGAAMVAWHSWMADPRSTDTPGAWLLFSGSGVRLDIWPSGADVQYASRNAYPRPAWFTFRRIAWLLNRATSIEPALDARSGLVVLRMTSSPGRRFFAPNDEDAELDSPGTCSPPKDPIEYRFCYVIWMDQFTAPAQTEGYRQMDTKRVVLYGSDRLDFTQLSIVPTVEHPELIEDAGVSPPTNTKNYPSDFSVDWRWPGWDWANIERGARSVSMDVVRAKAKGRPNPICILTDLPSARLAPRTIP